MCSTSRRGTCCSRGARGTRSRTPCSARRRRRPRAAAPRAPPAGARRTHCTPSAAVPLASRAPSGPPAARASDADRALGRTRDAVPPRVSGPFHCILPIKVQGPGQTRHFGQSLAPKARAKPHQNLDFCNTHQLSPDLSRGFVSGFPFFKKNSKRPGLQNAFRKSKKDGEPKPRIAASVGLNSPTRTRPAFPNRKSLIANPLCPQACDAKTPSSL